MSGLPRRVLLFDGDCGMCNRLVQFLIRRDRRERLVFAPLQGPFSARTLPSHGIDPEDLDTACLVTDAGTPDERVHVRSSAIVRATAALGGLWSVARCGLVVPRPLRDALYRFVANRRHRISKKLACPLMTPAERSRFLVEDASPASAS